MASPTSSRGRKAPASRPETPAPVMGVGETSQEEILDAFPAPPEPPAEPADPRMKAHKVVVGEGHVDLGIIVH